MAAARLKDSYESGGAQLVDVKDKVRAQRVCWLARLLSMPRSAYPRVVAGALIGQQNAGYYGLDVLTADIPKLGLKSQGPGKSMAKGGFYWEAILAWSALAPQLALAEGRLYNDYICFNPIITDENNRMYKPSKWMTKRDLYRIG